MTTSPPAQAEGPRNCPECLIPLTGTYCHQCGARPLGPHDLKLSGFLHEGLHELTHFDAKIFSTLRALIFKPGLLTTEYLAGRKKRYILPLRLFLVIFAISFFLDTRPVIGHFDVRYTVSRIKEPPVQSGTKRESIQGILQHQAEKRNLTKDALFDRINEHWQHDLSFFQLSYVFFFALWLALVFYTKRRYFVEHLIFSLHTISFFFVLSVVVWPYRLFSGPRFSWMASPLLFIILGLYLWKAIPRVYGASGWNALVKSLVLVAGLILTRVIFIVLTMVLALIQTFWKH
jgi:uncharacterized protein DUF3667